mmetsp:Transcript_23621/g.67727  ORF Transcript_23621/g.67727 Transcript_23621/m.67727 type:complete len:263 (+) Transcript_23621:51-839(+)
MSLPSSSGVRSPPALFSQQCPRLSENTKALHASPCARQPRQHVSKSRAPKWSKSKSGISPGETSKSAQSPVDFGDEAEGGGAGALGGCAGARNRATSRCSTSLCFAKPCKTVYGLPSCRSTSPLVMSVTTVLMGASSPLQSTPCRWSCTTTRKPADVMRKAALCASTAAAGCARQDAGPAARRSTTCRKYATMADDSPRTYPGTSATPWASRMPRSAPAQEAMAELTAASAPPPGSPEKAWTRPSPSGALRGCVANQPKGSA